jgi:hypothetical protein
VAAGLAAVGLVALGATAFAGAFVAGFLALLVAGVAFLVTGAFFAGLAPEPVFDFDVSRETSGIKAPKPRPRLCLFAIALTFLLTFGDFSRRS